MNKDRNAFTMIELVWVIVILGILAAVAIPKFAATRDDAHIAKARSTIAAVRSGIITERQTRLFRGDNDYINYLDNNASPFFSNVMQYGETAGKWTFSSARNYDFTLQGVAVRFIYDQNTGTFDCNRTNATFGSLCRTLID